MPYKTPELRRKDYQANRERDLAANRIWKLENKEHRAEVDKAWSERNKERVRTNRKAHYEANKEHVSAVNKAWKLAHPDQRRAHKMAHRARRQDAFVESVNPQVVFERDGGICQICHEPIVDKFHVDHKLPLIAGGEHSYANTQLSHPHCNLSKGAKV